MTDEIQTETESQKTHTSQAELEEELQQSGVETSDIDKKEFEQKIKEISKLSNIEYARTRKTKAAELQITAGMLDTLRKEYQQSDTKEKANALIEETEPYSEEVNGEELANEILSILESYLTFEEKHYSCAIALWVLGTFCFDCFLAFPRLLITSPRPRCGKSTLMNLLKKLVNKGVSASNITSSSIFRVIESCCPTLLIDEADTFLNSNEEMRGVVNSSHSKEGAHILRTEANTKTKNYDVKSFSTWAVIAIAMIKKPRDTIKDRSIIIPLKRQKKLKKQRMNKKSYITFCANMKIIRQKCKRWVNDNFEKLENHDPKIPETENDRLADNWFSLFVIAELLSEEWQRKAHQAFQHFNGENYIDDSQEIVLLQDIKLIVNELKSDKIDKIHSESLVQKLITLEDSQWANFKFGKPLNQSDLAKMLEPFEIKPRQMKISGINKKGYELNNFDDVFERYLTNTPLPPLQESTSLPFQPCLESEPILESTLNEKVDPKNDREPLPVGKGRGVEGKKGVEGGICEDEEENGEESEETAL